MFVGRKKEVSLLLEQFQQDDPCAVLVYGKRRIGKSTLIDEAAAKFQGVFIHHLCVQSSYDGNLKLLCRSVSEALGIPSFSVETIFDLFQFLGKQNKHILLVLDEYQYLKNALKSGEMDSLMQTVIDTLPKNVNLVLCGSYISVMRELLEEENPLFGRFTLILHLEALDYYDASMFYETLDTNSKIENYAVFGGSPYVAGQIIPDKSIKENICRLLLQPDGVLLSHVENVLLREIGKAYDTRIFEIIGNGRRRYSELLSDLNMKDTGLLDKQLKHLLKMDALTKVFPINKPNDKKKQFYELNDNLMRFYFTFIFGNQSALSRIGEEAFYDNYISERLNSFISLRFEDMVKQYFSKKVKEGRLKGILDIGSYWYDDKENHTNGQFDCVLKNAEGYDFYECKFFHRPMKKAEYSEEIHQIKRLCDVDVRNIGFVSSAGYSFSSEECELLDAGILYDNEG